MNDRWRDGAYLKVLKDHFPGHEFSEWQLLLVNAEDLTDISSVDIVDGNEQLRQLKKLVRSLETALVTLNSLHPEIRRSLEYAFSRNAKNSPAHRILLAFDAVSGDEPEPLATSELFALHLQSLVGHLLGQNPEQINLGSNPVEGRESCVKSAHSTLLELGLSSAQHARNETIEKSVLVANARRLWKKYKGKPAPKGTSAGKFFDFVGDLIDETGKEWKPESTIKAWRTLCESTDSYRLKNQLSYPFEEK